TWPQGRRGRAGCRDPPAALPGHAEGERRRVRRYSAGARSSLLAALLLLAACAAPSGPPERVTVLSRARLSAVADSPKRDAIIPSTLLFKLVAGFRGVDRNTKAGVYEFRRGDPLGEVLSALAEGRTASVRLTIPEGLTIPEVATLVAERVGIPADSF